MSTQSTSVSELNAVVETLLRKWMTIVALDAEVSFICEDEDADPARDEIIEYDILYEQFLGFGEIKISNNGAVQVHIDRELIDRFVIVKAPAKIALPKPLHDIFRKHCSSELLEADLDHIGIVVEACFDVMYQYSITTYLSQVVNQIQLDAFTETVLRPNAAALVADLVPYLPWFDYAAVIADQLLEREPHAQLIADMDLLLCYLSQGGQLNFAKMTSLCDVAGSLKPVRSLILKNMPELVV
jgi:hypothetical protein